MSHLTTTNHIKHDLSHFIYALTQLSKQHRIILSSLGGFYRSDDDETKNIHYRYDDDDKTLYLLSLDDEESANPSQNPSLSKSKQQRIMAFTIALADLSKQTGFALSDGTEVFFISPTDKQMKDFIYQVHLDDGNLDPMNWSDDNV
jgi:hypothetical protein